jgi:hypothetical protein
VTGDDPKGTVQLLADRITWDGFTIRGVFGEENGPGMYTSPDHSGYLVRDTIFEDNGVGLHLGANGEHPTLVCRNRFVANNEFAAGGFGVFSDEGARDVAITWNRFERHNGAGIFFADSTTGIRQHDILVERHKSVDGKTFAAFFASSRVRVLANASGPASGVGQFDVIGNRATANPVGIHLGPDTDDVVVDGSTAVENELDCQDRSGPGGTGTAGTENGWRHNVGVTDDPNGLCAPPVVDDTPGHDGKDHGKKHKKKSKRHHRKHAKKTHRPDPCACAYHPRSM